MMEASFSMSPQVLPAHFGFFLNIKFDKYPQDINRHVDSILTKIYSASKLVHDKVILSSQSTDICHYLNLKQPNFAVLYDFGEGQSSSMRPMIQSIGAAVNLARRINLFGIVVEENLLVGVFEESMGFNVLIFFCSRESTISGLR